MGDGLISLPARSIPGSEFQTAETRLRNLAADHARVDVGSMSLSNKEGAGKAGCPSAPMARVQQKSTRQNHRYRRIIRPSLRNGFTAYT